jgi:crossover junction endodeoxyribonuclease RusA
VPKSSLPIEFTVAGVPVSQQCRRKATKQAWISVVRAAAAAIFGEKSPASGPISMEIAYFYFEERIDIDVDNIAKPICDALKKLVYEDDKQVVELHLRKIWLGTFDIKTLAALPFREIERQGFRLH